MGTTNPKTSLQSANFYWIFPLIWQERKFSFCISLADISFIFSTCLNLLSSYTLDTDTVYPTKKSKRFSRWLIPAKLWLEKFALRSYRTLNADQANTGDTMDCVLIWNILLGGLRKHLSPGNVLLSNLYPNFFITVWLDL